MSTSPAARPVRPPRRSRPTLRVGLLALCLGSLTGGVTTVAGLHSPTDLFMGPDVHDPILFGMDAYSIEAQTAAGAPPDLGTLWLGPWNLEHGWLEPERRLAAMRAADVTPVVHVYYWGDDISPECVADGCWSDLHGVTKDVEGWQALISATVALLQRTMGNATLYVLLETEFNKNGMERDAGFPVAWAAHAERIRAGHPEALVVLPFGNWAPMHWSHYSDAVAAADLLGLQSMRASTRDSVASYSTAYASTLAGAEAMRELFEKPILVHDVALASYGPPPQPVFMRGWFWADRAPVFDAGDAWAQHQDEGIKDFFDGMSDLHAAGVVGLVYRSWHDVPRADVANHYGPAERHWGFVSAEGDAKPAAATWVDGVMAARGRQA